MTAQNSLYWAAREAAKDRFPSPNAIPYRCAVKEQNTYSQRNRLLVVDGRL